MFVYNYFNIIDFNIYNLIFNSCVDKMLYDINNLADYLSDIMAFYYPSMYNNLSNLCFPDQVNYLIKKKLLFLINFIFIYTYFYFIIIGKKTI